MADTPYPLPASARQTPVLLGNGASTYGPFGTGWGIFDIEDVLVETRPVATQTWVTAAVTVAKVNPLARYDFFTITFAAPITAATEFRVTGKRVQVRQLAVTRGGAIDGLSLELELSKQAVVLQEQLRDLKATAPVVAGDAASTAVAAAATATAAAAAAAASSAAFATAIAILVGNAGGTGDVMTVTHASFAGLIAYPNDMIVVLRHTAANTGAMTMAALPLAQKAFVDAKGDAFVGAEFAAGDMSIAEYNVTNNHWRVLRQIVKVARTDKANIFTAQQTYNAQQNANKPIVLGIQALVDAATIAWTMSASINALVTVTASRILGAPTGGVAGQEGYLDVVMDATGGWLLTFNAAYKTIEGNVPPQPDPGANKVTRYYYKVRGAADIVVSMEAPSMIDVLLSEVTMGAGTTFTISSSTIRRAYKRLEFIINGLSHNDAGNRNLRLELSGDNGAAWTAATDIAPAQTAAQVLDGKVTIDNAAALTGSRTVNAIMVNSAANFGGQCYWDVYAQALATGFINALRFSWNGTGSFDATGADTITLIGYR